MSAVRLLVLGAVIGRGTAHGYQVRKDLESWRIDLWGSIGQGSIYHALRRLEAEGQLDEVEDDSPSAGPSRTLYRATEAGRRTFRDLLEHTLASEESTPEQTVAAIGLLPELTRDRAIELLEGRLAAFRSRRERMVREHEQNPDEEWAHHVEAISYWNRAATAEIEWTAALIASLRAGAYTLRGEHAEEPPDHPLAAARPRP